MIWFRSANSHTGPQLHRCIRGRTDGSIRLRANLLQKPLALGGASTDEYTPKREGFWKIEEPEIAAVFEGRDFAYFEAERVSDEEIKRSSGESRTKTGDHERARAIRDRR
jgi:hypothetical protein